MCIRDSPRAVEHEYGIKIVSSLAEKEKFDAVILGVAHAEFLSLNVKSLIKDVYKRQEMGALKKDMIHSFINSFDLKFRLVKER